MSERERGEKSGVEREGKIVRERERGSKRRGEREREIVMERGRKTNTWSGEGLTGRLFERDPNSKPRKRQTGSLRD